MATLQTVRHPNIVGFYGMGTLDSGEPFLVMEFLERGSLRRVLDDQQSLEWDLKLVCGTCTKTHTNAFLQP